MRRLMCASIAFLGVLLFPALSANATITDFNCVDDGDGAIVMNVPTLTGSLGDYNLDVNGVQNWHPAHVQGEFTTDGDPRVWVLETVDNNTTFAWTDYHIDIGMTQSFTIDAALAPDGWYAVISDPCSGQPIPNGGTGWLGSIDYYVDTGGSPIAIGEEGDFGFKITFAQSVAFCTEQVPTPEPATIVLLGLGGLTLLRKKRK